MIDLISVNAICSTKQTAFFALLDDGRRLKSFDHYVSKCVTTWWSSNVLRHLSKKSLIELVYSLFMLENIWTHETYCRPVLPVVLKNWYPGLDSNDLFMIKTHFLMNLFCTKLNEVKKQLFSIPNTNCNGVKKMSQNFSCKRLYDPNCNSKHKT